MSCRLISSKNASTNQLHNVMRVWNVVGALHSRNGMTKKSYRPSWVQNVVLSMSVGRMRTWW